MSAKLEVPQPDTRAAVVIATGLDDAPLRFRALTRVSDDKLRSIPQQLADCQAYVDALERGAAEGAPEASRDRYRGAVIDGLYNLGEHSGFSMTESAVYLRMLEDARERRFHALVVRDTSRLGRDYWEKLGTLRDLRGAKVEFHVVEDGGRFDFEDRVSKVKSWASTWADEEKKMEEIRKAVRATDSVRDSGFPTTVPPFGYRLEKDPRVGRRVWRADPKAAPIVRACFAGVAAGRSLADLQREHKLTYAQLDRLLRNRSYLGGYLWRGEFRACAPQIVPPLVEASLFEAAAERRQR